MNYQFTSRHLTLDNLSRSNQGHMIGVYIIKFCMKHIPASKQILVQYWPNMGSNDGPTLAPNICPIQFAHWPNIGTLHWRNVGPIWEAKHDPM